MSAVNSPDGGSLTTMVEAQRGMTPSEALDFLTSGIVPDLSQPPILTPVDISNIDISSAQEPTLDEVDQLLSRPAITAGAVFSSLNSQHSDEHHSDVNSSDNFVQIGTKGEILEPPPGHETDLTDSRLTAENGSMVADSGEHDTDGMIALIPSVYDAERLVVTDGEMIDDLHLTLCYFPDVHLLPDELMSALLYGVEDRVRELPTVVADAFSVNVFNPQSDNPCVVLGVSGPQLATVRDGIYHTIHTIFTDMQLQTPKQHEPWIPHVTLAYARDVDVRQLTDRTGPITFDRVRMSWRGVTMDIPLGIPTYDAEGVEYEEPMSDAGVISATVDDSESFAERDVNAPGGTGHNLREYWVHGPGATKIGWGTKGSFKRCVAQLGKHVRDPEGLCAEYHHAATGEWPRGGVPSAGATEQLHGDVIYNEHDELSALANGQVVTVANDGQEEHVTSNTSDESPTYWSGVLTVEGIESGDGRMFAANALTWDDPPLPLMWQKETSHGGSGDVSVRVGSINKIWREPDASGRAGVFLIKGSGTVDVGSEDGREVARRMSENYLRGNSVDVDSVRNADVQLVFADPPRSLDSESTDVEVKKAETFDDIFAEPEVRVFTRGRIRATTLVEIPAFTEARVELVTDDQIVAAVDSQPTSSEDVVTDALAVLTAAASVIEIADAPPRSWFDEPTDVEITGALTVTSEGRVYGYVAPSDVRHRSYHNRAQFVPTRKVDYNRFMGGETIVADGGRVTTGNITMGCGHASTLANISGREAAEHYDNTCSIVATVRVGENSRGVWMAGALLPDVTPAQVRRIMACRLSGDWRPHLDRPGWREFVAALLVPVPGFPMARSAPSATSREGELVASSVPVDFVVCDHDEDDPIESTSTASGGSSRVAAARDRQRFTQQQKLTERTQALRARVMAARSNGVQSQSTERSDGQPSDQRSERLARVEELRARIKRSE